MDEAGTHHLLADSNVSHPGDGENKDSASAKAAWKRFFIVLSVLAILLGAELAIIFSNTPSSSSVSSSPAPVVINTWFVNATATAYAMVKAGYAALDAVEAGCSYCENAQCDGTVGWGSHPDTNGETTLDAIIMDGSNMNAGSVAYLRRVKNAISAARKVLHYSQHTMLAGDGATNFSTMMGLNQSDLHSPASIAEFDTWTTTDHCQPNFYANVYNVNTTCQPYVPIPTPSPTPMPKAVDRLHGVRIQYAAPTPKPASPYVSRFNHDTVGMCVLDAAGNIAGGGSSNGADHKIAGRVSDISVIGAGLYADVEAGCAACTGDGDITMRFLPAYQAVEFMRQGLDPQTACESAVRRIMRIYGTSFQIGLVCMSKTGEIGAASQGWTFTYATAGPATDGVATEVHVSPLRL